MTNETTASQPKSIGDDAQFGHLLVAWYQDKSESAKTYKKLIRYIDNFRAPAAQASATIQAAPDESNRAGWFVYEGNCWVATSSDDPRATKLYRAATIQEPAMVAEPDESQWIDRLTYDAEVDEWGIERRNLGAEIERLKSAAPMVADPAGVAVEHKRGCFARGSLSPIAHCTCGYDNALAATVKAVPSEALEGCEHCLHTYCLSSEICRHCGDVNGTQGYKGGKLAAPLADKTGGAA